ncbi:MAG: hypothetical protein Q9225_004179 [Loekoesia sp. 1 TL-2023]
MQTSEDSSSIVLNKTAAIQPLPEEVAAQIKSSTSISSLEHVAVGLFKNSLDAGSSRIDVIVDFGRGACTVEDDGWGISPTEFMDNGGLGKAYHTSKIDPRSTVYGRDGTFLASLAATSILTITSHHCANRSTATLIFHHARPAARLVPAPSHYQLLHREHGTKVEVHDLFGNMPVRVKQRSSALTNKKEHVREWESLRKSLIGSLLAWPIPVDAVIKDTEANRKITVKSKFTDSKDVPGGKLISRPLDLPWICSLLSQAGYIEPDNWDTWIKTSARTPYVTIRGAFSLQPVETKRIQFISLGIRHLRADTGASVLYDAVNHVFALSSFGNLEECLDDEVDERLKSKDKRYKKDGHTNKQLRGVGKGVDRWPMFVIHIELQENLSRRFGSRDILEQESTLWSIVKVIGAMTTGFLSDHHFRPRTSRKRRRPTSEQRASSVRNGLDLSQVALENSNPASTSEPRCGRTKSGLRARGSDRDTSFSQDLFGSTVQIPSFRVDRNRYIDEGFKNWSRIKSGPARGADDGFPIGSNQPKKADNAPRSPQGSPNLKNPSACGRVESLAPAALAELSNYKSSYVNDTHAGRGDKSSDCGAKGIAPGLNAGDTFPWTNPITKDTVLVNARTGLAVSHPQRPRSAATESTLPPGTTLPSIKDSLSSKTLARCTSAPTLPKDGSWVSNFLKNWENPVFAPATEQDIPRVSFDGTNPGALGLTPGKHHRCSHLDLEKAFSNASSALSSKLSKASLAEAQIISQVDKKFVLALMQPSRPIPTVQIDQPAEIVDQQILVLIDQHAADERIRVENLLADFCTGPSPEILRITSSFEYKPAVTTTLLPKPLAFQIKPQEHGLFTAQAQHFANWGILYDLSPPCSHATTIAKETLQAYKITVKALPPVIAERCRLEPKLLIDLLRKEIWKREEDGFTYNDTTSPSFPENGTEAPQREGTGDWLTLISTCPRGILDLLNSRSCRSAIMFNDELSNEECETLVKRLAGCRFPFQCAHGRPSMVPLVGVGGEGIGGRGGFGRSGGALGKKEEGREDFVGAWKRWREEVGGEGEGEEDSP